MILIVRRSMIFSIYDNIGIVTQHSEINNSVTYKFRYFAQEMQKEKDKMAAVSQVTKLKIHILQFIFLMKFLII
jgi:hypothetical protein